MVVLSLCGDSAELASKLRGQEDRGGSIYGLIMDWWFVVEMRRLVMD